MPSDQAEKTPEDEADSVVASFPILADVPLRELMDPAPNSELAEYVQAASKSILENLDDPQGTTSGFQNGSYYRQPRHGVFCDLAVRSEHQRRALPEQFLTSECVLPTNDGSPICILSLRQIIPCSTGIGL